MTDKEKEFAYDSRTIDPKESGWYRHNSRITQSPYFP